MRYIGVGAFEVVVGLAIVGGDVLKIGYDKEADFIFVGCGGLFQVLQDVVYVCVGGDGFEIEFAAEGNFAMQGHIGDVGARGLVLQFGNGGFRGIEQA